MESFKDIIDAYGLPVLAEAIGVSRSHVHVMRARDSIPPVYWSDLVEKAPAGVRGKVSFELLKELRAGRFVDASESNVAPEAAE